MSPLTTVALGNNSGLFQSLDIHITNDFPAIARNIFILKTICDCDPKNAADLNYIWDLIYNATSSESTHKRFTEDVKNLLKSPLPQNIIIPASFHEELKEICTGWLLTMTSLSVDHVLADR